MATHLGTVGLLALTLLGVACSPMPGQADAGDGGPLIPGCVPDAGALGAFQWKLPRGFPVPPVPADNPMSDAKVELGRHLFYDKRLSLNETQSCASCHQQDRGFADDKVLGVGSTGEVHPRNPMGLGNVAYAASLTWANPLMLRLEQQAVVPIFGSDPIELGLRGKEDTLRARLEAEPRYQKLFPGSFPGVAQPITLDNMVKAIAAFERTLISGDSKLDRFLGGDKKAISQSANRGRELFESEQLECFHCHNGFTMSDAINFQCKSALELRFHNTGLYNLGGTGAYPANNTGVAEISGDPKDMGRFKAPSLRNIAVTAPYMHDGSIATLDGVLDHYSAAGRTLDAGVNAGVGSASPFKSGLIIGFTLTPQERADVIAFLESLTDDTFLKNPDFADPWGGPCVHCPP